MRYSKIIMAFIALAFAGVFILSGCNGKGEESVKIKDIQEQEGIPVVVKKMTPETMVITKTYSGTIRGKKEAMARSAIGGNIESILVKVGQYVQKDQTIAKFRDDEPMSQYRQAKAAFENSKENLERFEELFKAGAVSKQQLDEIRTMHEVNKANFEASEKQIYVKAPISGYIGDLMVDVGDGVGMDTPIASITDLNDMSIRIDVPESDIGHIDRKSSVKILQRNGNGKKFDGKISEVSLTANQTTRSFEVEIEVDNPEKSLKSGIIVEVEIGLIEKENTYSTLREVINTDEEGREYVYIVDKNKHAKKTLVETGVKYGVQVEIVEGISDGDLLVTSGASLLSDGDLVKIIEKDS